MLYSCVLKIKVKFTGKQSRSLFGILSYIVRPNSAISWRHRGDSAGQDALILLLAT